MLPSSTPTFPSGGHNSMWGGIKIQKWFITTYRQPLPPIEINSLHEHFYLGKECYLQVQCTTMGTCMAPSYTNLLMGKLGWEFLHTPDKVPLVWWRYINDVFAMWTHGEESLCLFMENSNSYHTTFKFTAVWSLEEVTIQGYRVLSKEWPTWDQPAWIASEHTPVPLGWQLPSQTL